jgi:RNA polymerase sigma-70 factor (ECF subfamily)
MISRAAGVLLVCLATSAFARADDAASREVKELEGEWHAVEAERDGKTSTADDVTNLRLVFKRDEIIIKSGDGTGGERKKKFKLDSGKTPKAIDITSLDGQEKGVTSACIYSLVKSQSKGRLRLCMPYSPKKDPSERPTEFRTQVGDGLMLIVLERVNPK